jgi:hypothetical protein
MNTDDFRQQLRQAGITDDKPLSSVLLTAFQAAETARSAAQDGARGLTPEGEADLIKRVTQAITNSAKSSLERHRLRLEGKASWIAGGVIVANLLLGGGGGYLWGWSSARQSVQATERDIALAFQHGADAADTWRQLMQNNDPLQALGQCNGNSLWSTNGRQACLVPLWIDGSEAPPTNRK